jgi:hypothetical protein
MTQQRLADSMGVALGLPNSYLRRCIRTGREKIKQTTVNRYLYCLTPTGFDKKIAWQGLLRVVFRFLS